jgi:hypothetical protein
MAVSLAESCQCTMSANTITHEHTGAHGDAASPYLRLNTTPTVTRSTGCTMLCAHSMLFHDFRCSNAERRTAASALAALLTHCAAAPAVTSRIHPVTHLPVTHPHMQAPHSNTTGEHQIAAAYAHLACAPGALTCRGDQEKEVEAEASDADVEDYAKAGKVRLEGTYGIVLVGQRSCTGSRSRSPVLHACGAKRQGAEDTLMYALRTSTLCEVMPV